MSYTPKVPPIAKSTSELPLDSDDGTIVFDTSEDKPLVIKNNNAEDISGGDPQTVGTPSIVFFQGGRVELVQGDLDGASKKYNNPPLGDKVNYLVIGSSCTKIQNQCFLMNAFGEGTTENFKIVIPPNVKTIRAGAFNNIDSVATTCGIELEFHEGLETIDTSGFSNTEALTGDIKLPESLTDLGMFAFVSCGNSVDPISKFTFNAGITIIPFRVLSNSFVDEIIIPEGIIELHAGCFYNCSVSTPLNIPSSVTNIQEEILSFCLNLTTINSYAAKGAFKNSSLSYSNITTIHAKINDNSWAAGTGQTIGGKSGIEVIKDLT